ncbi:RNA-directed DNA polymerase from transposon x-element [Colletotrichum limetticola]|uniref:RNA-directed DNA polymerase from transposon x-element n=1 Tax=Colletotrichum limetticola TaxID=1209924 RepID=A0ABQ9PC38_9PEZI|nr:RNA-directed DNA polymerase from transposon x-element [Colletotrichum limetticola]
MLRAAQGNVGKISPAHTAFLQLCWEAQMDVVLVQEPWTGWKDGNVQLNTHPGFDSFVPVDFWDSEGTRPRVLTYTRKGIGMKVEQQRPVHTRDVLWLVVDKTTTIVNIYRQPSDPHSYTTEILLELKPPERTLIAGDFNAHHYSWEPGARNGNRVDDIAGWADGHNLSLISEVGVATQVCGHVLDLAFSNIPFAHAQVSPQLHPGADHEAIVAVIPLPRRLQSQGEDRPQTRPPSVPDSALPRLRDLIKGGQAAMPNLDDHPTSADLDGQASHIVELFSRAIEAVGKERGRDGESAAWWTEECAEVHRAYRAARNQQGWETEQDAHLSLKEERKAFLSIVRKAKRAYWSEKIDRVASDRDLYQIMGWRKASPLTRAPPLVVGNQTIEDTNEKAQALREALLDRFSAEDDAPGDPFDVPVVPRRAITWQENISGEEVKAATLTKTTIPGVDGITTRLLQACWGVISEPVRLLFQSCIRVGYFPLPFRRAEVVMIQEAGRDASKPGSWRPIALLSCLGKGLERLRARRMASLAIVERIVSSQQIGALQGRSAVDLTTCLTHDIEMALLKGLTAMLLTMHLTNTKRGLPAAAVRKAVVSCVLPTALFGAETWYAGITKPASRRQAETATAPPLQGRPVNIGQKGLVQKINSVITAAARAILPVWRTTPTSSFLRDAGLPSAQVALEGVRLRAAVRLQRIDRRHPLVARLSQQGQHQTRLQLVQCKEEAAKAFERWLKTVPESHSIVFSDGSRATNGAVGYGFVIYRDSKRIAQGCGRLGLAEVFDAEVEGARAGLRRALLTNRGHPIHICIDNTSVIQGIRGKAPDSSQEAFLEIQEAARIFDIRTHWSPGQQGIEGNEAADRLAKEETTLPARMGQMATLAGIKRLARENVQGQHRRWWYKERRPRYADLGLEAALFSPPELALPWATLHHLLAARSGHGDFEQYHRRFNHDDTLTMRQWWPTLHSRSTPEPIGPMGSLEAYFKRLITDPRDFEAFLGVTDFFQKICPR